MGSSEEKVKKSSLKKSYQQRGSEEDNHQGKDDSTANKEDKDEEKPMKIKEIVANLKKPSTFFRYINMRESKRKRRASIELSDDDGSRPVSAPDLGEVESNVVE